MFVLDMGIEGGITQIFFSADAGVVSFHGVVSGSSFPSGYELFLAFEGVIFGGVHLCLNFIFTRFIIKLKVIYYY